MRDWCIGCVWVVSAGVLLGEWLFPPFVVVCCCFVGLMLACLMFLLILVGFWWLCCVWLPGCLCVVCYVALSGFAILWSDF